VAADPSIAMAAVIFVAFWKGFPFSTVIFLAALQNRSTRSRSTRHGSMAPAASAGCRCRHPARSAGAAVNAPTTILTFNYFDIIYVLTRGGPLNATVIFPTRIYEVGFGRFGSARPPPARSRSSSSS
jgi:multiple sugar transport system permease protein